MIDVRWRKSGRIFFSFFCTFVNKTENSEVFFYMWMKIVKVPLKLSYCFMSTVTGIVNKYLDRCEMLSLAIKDYSISLGVR